MIGDGGKDVERPAGQADLVRLGRSQDEVRPRRCSGAARQKDGCERRPEEDPFPHGVPRVAPPGQKVKVARGLPSRGTLPWSSSVRSEMTAIQPFLTCRDAPAAVEFYKRAFGATELSRAENPNGIVAELELEGAPFMVVDEAPQAFNVSPVTLGGTSVRIHLEVDDPDAVAARAVAEGAREIFPIADQPYGWRQGRLEDPFGHHWLIGRPL
jgi:PhnB protein